MKEKLSACVTWGDSDKVFKETPNASLRDFISALENAKDFIDLTMRDEFLLNQATSILNYR
jgi:hypothetical protein